MVHETAQVIREFNEYVNMTHQELSGWMSTEDSKDAGWHAEGDSGETVGHESAGKIIEILKANPDKEPAKYNEEHIAHMRKVVAYCKRHLAQEQEMVDEKSEEELKTTKSYKSLKNWGHDCLKAKHATNESNLDKRKKDEAETDTEQQEIESHAGKDSKKQKTDASQPESLIPEVSEVEKPEEKSDEKDGAAITTEEETATQSAPEKEEGKEAAEQDRYKGEGEASPKKRTSPRVTKGRSPKGTKTK